MNTDESARHPDLSRRRWLQGLVALGLAPVSPAGAQPVPSPLPSLSGRTPDGRLLQLSSLRGRVVLVFYWSTGCAVCRDKMAELRANLAGWQRQPFTLVGVNTDAHQKDFLDYEALVVKTIAPVRRFDSVWAGQPGFVDTMEMAAHAPSAYLVDKQGRLVERYSGRIPPEAWDRIAELL